MLGWLGSGPRPSRPLSSVPESQELPTAEQRGARSAVSNTAVSALPLVAVSVMSSLAWAAPSLTVRRKTYVPAVDGVTLATAWLAFPMATVGPETWLQANASGEGPPSGSEPLPLSVALVPVGVDLSGPALAVGGRLPPPGSVPLASSAR